MFVLDVTSKDGYLCLMPRKARAEDKQDIEDCVVLKEIMTA
jgi:hypothetical protein